ncbi:o-succinylbenzoate synthase [Aestuariimicrobium sp. p3-SID1156]|uniref:o-succinylbenzoate synthase n=1 Tax=Aestuariimicrobium sp. p3-SID1156 TaxID=2916038 RepID=UPI00223B9E5C|nr:o-succinylbenzoate synthase [Aestuariimicrobium sp. p3-SID1156]MCT1458755.1 o-succinylbenzoate synthase [Aestuariimicrobium sp. p3-SID1156]
MRPGPLRERGVEWVEDWRVFDLPMRTRFRGITRRRGMLLRGPAGWAEWSPFEEYDPAEAAQWWRACVETATLGHPVSVRGEVPVNVTIPAEDPGSAHARVLASECRTAKVKVAEKGQAAGEDVARVEAVRDALGGNGKLRVDANGGWSVGQALAMIKDLRAFDLEYVEQPCATVEELAALRRELARRGWDVPLAADESIRRSGDPERVVAMGAADVAVIKLQPLGGARACLELVERLGLPVVISSALESSVGLDAGVRLAAALPELDQACGLNTAALLTRDVVEKPLVAEGGVITVREVTPDLDLLDPVAAEVEQWWLDRLEQVLAVTR